MEINLNLDQRANTIAIHFGPQVLQLPIPDALALASGIVGLTARHPGIQHQESKVVIAGSMPELPAPVGKRMNGFLGG